MAKHRDSCYRIRPCAFRSCICHSPVLLMDHRHPERPRADAIRQLRCQPLQRGRLLVSAILLGSSLGLAWQTLPPAQGQVGASCVLTQKQSEQKDSLLRASLKGDETARTQYQALLTEQAANLKRCRSQTWPRNQAIWLRLYPCDLRPGILDQVLDQVVNMGYNRVYIESFRDGQVLLPEAENNTAWPSIVKHPNYRQRDLLAEALQKARARGLTAYSWLFSMNFGYSYATRADRVQAIAINGRGQTSLDLVEDGPQVFVDPYSRLVINDYAKLVRKIVERRPDGVLFDYIRFPRGKGTASVVGNIKDLPIYSEAAQQAMIGRATNNRGRAVIQRFLQQGSLKASDIAAATKRFPGEGPPTWQGRQGKNQSPAAMQQELWLLGVAHAQQGVIDFLNAAIGIVQQERIPTGAVFFPTGNQQVGNIGFDSRLQAWDRFPGTIEWHPMAYANCTDAVCIANEVQRVVVSANGGTDIQPALAGAWGQVYGKRPPLETQMRALRSFSGRINTVSHFAYSWMQPESDRQRKQCRL